MKNLYILLYILLLTSIKSTAQLLIIDIEEKPTIWETPIINAYYKDINNFYNGFEGTWIATKGNKTLKIVLKKEYKIPNDIPYYADYMYGEYQYIENGSEMNNTLNNNNRFNRGIVGGYLLKSYHKPICSDCSPNKRRLKIGFFDRTRNVSANLYLQHTIINGKQALKGLIYGNGVSYNLANPPVYFHMAVPTGLWTFIKE